MGATSYKSVESILSKRLEAEPLPLTPEPSPDPAPVITHRNVRGPDYYRSPSSPARALERDDPQAPDPEAPDLETDPHLH